MKYLKNENGMVSYGPLYAIIIFIILFIIQSVLKLEKWQIITIGTILSILTIVLIGLGKLPTINRGPISNEGEEIEINKK